MKTTPIKTGLLAFGMSGRLFHAPFINHHPEFLLHAVTERHQKKAEAIYPEVRSFANPEQMINDPELELVVINTPNNTHFEYAKMALAARKHVLIEKPFTATVAEAEELFELADQVGCYILPYQNRRWDSDFLSVKNVIESGKLGKIIEVHFRYDRYKPALGTQAFKEARIPASGLAYNLGPHVIDQAIALFGEPVSFHKTTAANRTGSLVDDYAFFHLTYPDNLHVYLHMSLLVARPLPSYVIHGTTGSFIKDRTDVQEKQLNEAISPAENFYGIESKESWGELTYYNLSATPVTEKVEAPRGNYSGLFDAVHEQIRFDIPFPVQRKHILSQLEMLVY